MKRRKRTGKENERERQKDHVNLIKFSPSIGAIRPLSLLLWVGDFQKGRPQNGWPRVSTSVLCSTKRKQNTGCSVLSPLPGLRRSELTSTTLSRPASLNDPSLSLSRKRETISLIMNQLDVLLAVDPYVTLGAHEILITHDGVCYSLSPWC